MLLLVLGMVVLMPACGIPPAAIITPGPLAPTQTTAPTPGSTNTSPSREETPALPEHRIGVRVVDGAGEFYDRGTGEAFVPRGNNYIHIAPQTTIGGGTLSYHATFNPGLYDVQAVEAALGRMQADGYNVVRVFLNGCCRAGAIGDVDGGLSDGYIANVVDFLQRAKAHQIYVLIATDGLPAVGGYIEILDSDWTGIIQGNNASHLRGGGVRAERAFWRDFLRALIALEAPLDVIFGYELRNEQFFSINEPPLNQNSGVARTANGRSYDLSSEEERRRMLEEGLVYWINGVRAEILKYDPTALVAVGFFVPQEPLQLRPGDPRWVTTIPAIRDSQADFIDLHAYPGFGVPLDSYARNFGMQGLEEKPIILGEFGILASGIYASPSVAAAALREWQIQSCAFGFDGWLFWTWDYEDEVFQYALAGEGEINQALAPANRPNPCQ